MTLSQTLSTPRMVCPICLDEVKPSPWLTGIFYGDPAAMFAANLVTHYRHRHIHYYDDEVSKYNGVGYLTFKRKVNNRAMRQLIRAFRRMKPYGYLSIIHAFGSMSDIDDKTYRLI